MECQRWFAVIVNNEKKSMWTSNYTVEEHEVLAPDLQCLFWVRLTDTGKIHPTKTPYEYKIYDYDLFDSRKRKLILNIKGWKLLELRDSPFKNSFEPGYGIFSDPWGKEKKQDFVHRDEDMVILAYDYLMKISEHDSWETYDIKMEMERMKRELEELKKIVEKLKS